MVPRQPVLRKNQIVKLLAVYAVESSRCNEADGHLFARSIAYNGRNSFPREILQTIFPLHSMTHCQLGVELEPESAWHDLRV